MASKTLSQAITDGDVTQNTDPQDGDYLYLLDDPTGSPASEYIAVSALATKIQGGTFAQLTVDNLRLDGNILSSVSGALTLTPLAGQNLNVNLSTTGDFAVNTDQLYVDTSTGYVGFGTPVPVDKLSVIGNINVGYNGTTARYIQQTFATAHASGNRGATIGFGMQDAGGLAGMTVTNASASNPSFNAQYITFSTHEGGISTGERVRITSIGTVGIGISTGIDGKTHIDQSSTTAAIPVLTLDQADVSEQAINIRSDGNDVDINLITVEVTGLPTMSWNETADVFSFSKGLALTGDLAVNGGDITSTSALTLTPLAGQNLNVSLSGAGDFAVNTSQLYVDTSTGNSGFGTTEPVGRLDVLGPSNATSGGRVILDDDGAYRPRIRMYKWSGGASTYYPFHVITNGDGSGVSTLSFSSQSGSSNIGSESVSEVMVLKGNGIVGIGISTGLDGKTHIDQSSTTAAIPVLTLDQADLSEQFIKFMTTIGTGNPIEAVGAKTLTTTHFIRIEIDGVGDRYLPVGTIA
jgi:hypothetical protein